MSSERTFDIRAVKTERLPPDPKGTAQALQRIGYTLEDALADLIDNSIDARASKVLISFFRDDRAMRRVAIVDNGYGMDEATLHSAMQYGVQVPRRGKDLGKYGIGLKTASFSQCQTLSVFSRRDRKASGRRWTFTKMQDDWRCEILDPKASEKLLDLGWNDLDLSEHGTVVLWNDLDGLGAGTEIDKLIRRVAKELPVELGLKFHRFIADDRLRLTLEFARLDAR